MLFTTYFKLQDKEIKALQKQYFKEALSLEDPVSVSRYEGIMAQLDAGQPLDGENEAAFRALLRATGQKFLHFADAEVLSDGMRSSLYALVLRGEVSENLLEWLSSNADSVFRKNGGKIRPAAEGAAEQAPSQMFIQSAFNVRKLYDISASGDIYAIDGASESIRTNALNANPGLSAVSGLRALSVDRFAAAVTSDGHVVRFEKESPSFLDETYWNGIEQVLVNGYTVYGVKKDGRVVSTNDFECRGWTNIARLTVVNGAVIGIRTDGGVRENRTYGATALGSLVNVADIVGDYVLFRNGRVKSIRMDRFVAMDMIAVCDCMGKGVFLRADGTLDSDYEPLRPKLAGVQDVVSIASYQNVLHFITRDGAYHIMTVIDGRVVPMPFRLSPDGARQSAEPEPPQTAAPAYTFREGERIALADGQWTVLKVLSDKVLLLRNGTLEQCFSVGGEPATWKDCTLRQWLNGEYLASAPFNGVRDHIIPTKLNTFPNPVYDRKNANAVVTTDHIFCLSLEETKLYERILRGMGERWIMRTGGQNESFTAAWEVKRPDLWGVRGDFMYGVKPAMYIEKAYLASVAAAGQPANS